MGKPDKIEIPADDAAAAALVADLLAIEAEIAELQDDKGTIYKAARETYGKRFANGLKLAVKIERMDQDKLSEADEVDAEAERILAAFRKPRAPRATRARENIEEFPVKHDEDGVFPDDEPQPAPAAQMRVIDGAGLSASHDLSTSVAGPEGIEGQQTIQPETANTIPDEPTDGGPHESAAHHPVEPFGRRPDDNDSHSAGGQTNEAVTISAPIAEGEGAHNAPSAPTYAEPGIITMESCPPVGIVAHPYAACWPVNIIDVSGGVQKPIVKIGRFILDGRGRYFGARAAGMEYPVVQYDGDDELADCILWNMESRTMSDAALRMVAQKLAKAAPDRADEIFARMGLSEERQAAE